MRARGLCAKGFAHLVQGTTEALCQGKSGENQHGLGAGKIAKKRAFLFVKQAIRLKIKKSRAAHVFCSLQIPTSEDDAWPTGHVSASDPLARKERICEEFTTARALQFLPR